MFKLEIETTNEVFQGDFLTAEVMEVLRTAARRVGAIGLNHSQRNGERLFDSTGNCVGAWSFKPECDDHEDDL